MTKRHRTYSTRGRLKAKRVEQDGHKFDSQAEFKRYCQLKLLERAGEISNLQVHPKFDLTYNGRPILIRSAGFPNGRKATFKPDFGYLKVGAGVVYEDVKGVATEAYRIRRAIFEAIYFPAQVEEIAA